MLRTIWQQRGNLDAGRSPEAGCYFGLVCGEGGQHLIAFPLRHVEVVKRSAELSRDLIEHLRRYVEGDVCVAEVLCGVFEWPTCNGANPECPQEFQPRQAFAVLHSVPFS